MSHLFGFIIWNVDPDFIHRGAISIRWFGFLYAVAFYIAYRMMSGMYKNEKLPHKEAERLVIYLAIGILLGARLGRMLIFDPQWYWEHPLDIFKFWEGRLYSYGAALGAIVAIYIYVKKGFAKSYLWILDRLVIVVCLGSTFIRLGNLMNSGYYGKETNVPWAFKFISDPVNKGFPPEVIKPHHPSQIYEALLFLTMFIILYRLYQRKRNSLKSGTLTGIALVGNYSVLFFLDYLQPDKTGLGMWLLSRIGINVDQTIAIIFVIGGILILALPQKYLAINKSPQRKPKPKKETL